MPDRQPLPDVKYVTINFTVTGAFMVAMSREKASARPKTVKTFMAKLADYARAHAETISTGPGRREKAPDVPKKRISSQKFEVSFRPNPGDTSPDPLGTWAVDAVLEVRNVRRGAKMRLFTNSASSVHIRLPERQNIAAKEDIALDHEANGTQFDKMPYIDDYFSGKKSAMEFVWDNVGDYTTRSCR